MTYEIEILDSANTENEEKIALAGELNIFHASELKPQLLDYLGSGKAIEVDLARIKEVDTTGIQLLLVAKREATSLNCQLRFVNHSDALLEVIDLLNLSRDFGDPLLITAHREEEINES